LEAYFILVFVPSGAIGNSKYCKLYRWWQRRRDVILKFSSTLFLIEASGYGMWLVKRLERLIGQENIHWYLVRSRGTGTHPEVERLADKERLTKKERQLLDEIRIQIT